jgi:hypothetical protein
LPWLLLSAPAVTLVTQNQVQTATGFAALTASIWLARHDRWTWSGTAFGVALLRPGNALPLLPLLALACWGKPRAAVRFATGFASLLAPLCALAFAWDRAWPFDYARNLGVVAVLGPARLARESLGAPGVLGLTVAGCLLVLALAWRRRNSELDLDLAAFAMAITVPLVSLAGFYAGIFLLPALARLALRSGFKVVAALIAMAPWIVELLAAPILLGPAPQHPSELTVFVLVAMALAMYPLAVQRTSDKVQAVA